MTIFVQQNKGKEADGESRHCKSVEISRQTYVKEFRKVSGNELFACFHQVYTLSLTKSVLQMCI